MEVTNDDRYKRQGRQQVPRSLIRSQSTWNLNVGIFDTGKLK